MMDALFAALAKAARNNPDQVVAILDLIVKLLKTNPELLGALIDKYAPTQD
jgi:hypothetical protein